MKSRAPRLLSTAIGVAVIASGCGGSGDGATETPQQAFAVQASTTMTIGSLTKPQFVARVNDLCHRKWPVILENFTEYSSWQSPRLSKPDLFAKSVRLSFLAGLDFHIFDNIRKLKAPNGEKKQVEEVIGKMQTAVERGQRELHAYSASQLSAQFADYNQAARRYGFDNCVVSGARVLKAEA